MNPRIRYAAISFFAISIAVTLLLVWPEVNRSRAKTGTVTPAAYLKAGTPDPVEEIVTLKPARMISSTHFYSWRTKAPYCGAPTHAFEVSPTEEEIPGTVFAGFQHRYDAGAKVLGCPDGDNTVHRGAVWFDLSEIMSKAPALHVSVQSATLRFSPSLGCASELLVGTENWLKGHEDNTLIAGDRVATLGVCIPGPEGCSIDVSVETVVNNWLKGPEHGGYENYGFVFKGMQEADLKYSNADACVARFGDFSLILNYKYDEGPVAKLPDSYPLLCRGGDSFKLTTGGPAGSKDVGFTFSPGANPAKDGLMPGQCTWLDRGMRAGEPGRLAQSSGSAGAWTKELNSSDSYWTFNVYNAGEQLRATGAEHSTRPGTDVAKPGGSLPGGDSTAFARINHALAANGGTASASSELDTGRTALAANNGDTWGLHWGSDPATGSGWHDATKGVYPDWWRVDFKDGKPKPIDEIDVYAVQDNVTAPEMPRPDLFFTQYGITDYDVQYWTGGEWKTIASVAGPPNLVWRKFTFPPVKTSAIRILVKNAQNDYSRIVEVEAWER